jgi:hypothetical protein
VTGTDAGTYAVENNRTYRLKFRCFNDGDMAVERIELCTFAARITGSRKEAGQRLYRIEGTNRFGHGFWLEVTRAVLNDPRRLCRAILIGGGAGSIVWPLHGHQTEVWRAIHYLSDPENYSESREIKSPHAEKGNERQ